MSERRKRSFWIYFDGLLKLEFHRVKVSNDSGLLDFVNCTSLLV